MEQYTAEAETASQRMEDVATEQRALRSKLEATATAQARLENKRNQVRSGCHVKECPVFRCD